MTRRLTGIVVLAASFALIHQSPAFAQQQGTSQQAAGSASTLSSAQGYGLDSRFSGSGFDTYTQGGAGVGTTTAGARAGTAGYGMSGTTVTGRTTTTSNRFGGMTGMSGMGMMGMGMYGMGRNMYGQNSQMSTQGNKVIRTRARLGFSQPSLPTAAAVGSFTKVITRVLDRGDYGAGKVAVAMEGSVAVLKGTVDSDHARDVAERLALLEPGISEVRNELIVRAAAPTPGTLPRASSVGQPR